MTTIKAVKFISHFGKLSSVSEGGIKLTLNVPQTEALSAVDLMQFQDKLFITTIEVVEPDTVGAGS